MRDVMRDLMHNVMLLRLSQNADVLEGIKKCSSTSGTCQMFTFSSNAAAPLFLMT